MSFTLAFTLDASPPTSGAVVLPTPVAAATGATSGAVKLPTAVLNAAAANGGAVVIPTPQATAGVAGQIDVSLTAQSSAANVVLGGAYGLGIGTGAGSGAQMPFVFRMLDGRYRVYFAWFNGSYGQLQFKDTSDTNPPSSANITGGAGTALNIGSATAADNATTPFVMQLPSGAYRVYYGLNNGSTWSIQYKDTVDTNPPSNANIPAGSGTTIASGLTHAYQPIVLQKPDGSYRLYFVGTSATYWSVYYKDTTDLNPPNSTNAGTLTAVNMGGTSTTSTIALSISALPGGGYRVYATYNTGSLYQIYYKDTSDTNIPSAANIAAGTGTSLGISLSSTTQSQGSCVVQLPTSKYRLYTGFFSTYWDIQYRDTADSNLPGVYPTHSVVSVATANISAQPGISASLPLLVASISDKPSIKAQAPLLAGSVTGDVGSYITAAAPLASASMQGAYAGAIQAAPRAAAAAIVGAVGVNTALVAAAPLPSVTLTDGSSRVTATAAAATATLSAVAGVAGAVTARSPWFSASVTGYVAMEATISATARRANGTLSAVLSTVGTMQAATRAPRAALTALRGTSGALSATAPVASAQFGTLVRITGGIQATAPRAQAAIDIYLPPVQLETLCVNTLTTALSHYVGWNFNSFCELGGKYLAAGPTGLYQIELPGDDAGAQVDALLVTGDLDFSNEYLKRITDFYTSMRAGGDMLLRVTADEGEASEYNMQSRDITTLKQRRILTAKGARGKYWRFELENVAGCDFEFDSMNVTAVPMARRV